MKNLKKKKIKYIDEGCEIGEREIHWKNSAHTTTARGSITNSSRINNGGTRHRSTGTSSISQGYRRRVCNEWRVFTDTKTRDSYGVPATEVQ